MKGFGLNAILDEQHRHGTWSGQVEWRYYSPLGWHEGAAVDIGFIRSGMIGHWNKEFVSLGTVLHREAKMCSTSQEICNILWNPNVHYDIYVYICVYIYIYVYTYIHTYMRVYINPQLSPLLMTMNPTHNLSLYFLNILFNIILTIRPGFPLISSSQYAQVFHMFFFLHASQQTLGLYLS